jgi:hypothetical protein
MPHPCPRGLCGDRMGISISCPEVIIKRREFKTPTLPRRTREGWGTRVMNSGEVLFWEIYGYD